MLFQVGRRAEEFSEAQVLMRESVVQRRQTIVIEEENVETSTPIEPANRGSLGGELITHESVTHTDISTTNAVNTNEKDVRDNCIDSNINVLLIYNTRL